jgi:hypothetical protein
LQLSGLPATTTALSANTDFRVQVGLPNAGATGVGSFLPVRAGSPGLTATLDNSDAGVARLTTTAGTAQTQTVTVAAGQFSSPSSLATGGVQFDPLTTGTTTVAAAIPSFLATVAASQNVAVTGAGISFSGLPTTVGAGLMSAGGAVATLGASNHGGVTVRIESSNPALALVSPNASTAGTAFFDAVVPNGSTQVNFVVHGLENATGSATITASAPGFTNGTGLATVAQPALRLSGLPATTTALSANTGFRVQVGLPNAGATDLASVQQVRAGSPGLTATLDNSDAAVAQLTTTAGSAQTRTVAIAAGQFSSPSSLATGGVQFDPLAAGTTQVSGTASGFITTTAGTVSVSVTP